jgi:hypothetical protein
MVKVGCRDMKKDHLKILTSLSGIELGLRVKITVCA